MLGNQLRASEQHRVSEDSARQETPRDDDELDAIDRSAEGASPIAALKTVAGVISKSRWRNASNTPCVQSCVISAAMQAGRSVGILREITEFSCDRNNVGSDEDYHQRMLCRATRKRFACQARRSSALALCRARL